MKGRLGVATLLSAFIACCLFLHAKADTFDKYFFFRGNAFYYAKANETVTLKKYKSGSATFRSRSAFIHGFFSAQIKLPCNDTSGIVSSYFLTSGGKGQDEIDIEFLGHVNPRLVLLHTNVFGAGKGSKEEGYTLWFNPCQDFHNYTILWNKEFVVWFVDSIPIRVYNRVVPETNVTNPFPTRPMYIHGSTWFGSGWATQSGLIKPNFNVQPWFLQFRNFDVSKTCLYVRPRHLTCNKPDSTYPWDLTLTPYQLNQLSEFRSRYLKYSYLSG